MAEGAAVDRTGAPPAGNRTEAAQSADELVILGLLRQIRASAQAIDDTLLALGTTLGTTDPTQRWASLVETAPQVKSSSKSAASMGQQYVGQTTELIGRAPELRDWLGDEATVIQLSWSIALRALEAIHESLSGLPKSADQARVDQLNRSIRIARPALSKVIVAAATLTIPNRLNQHLAQSTVGRSLNFKTLFANELPGDAERAEVLRQIGDAPASVNGIVDLTTGNVVVVSASQGRRRLSYVMEAAALIVGGLLAYLIVGSVKGLLVRDGLSVHPTDPAAAVALSNLVTILFAFVGGAVFHFIVDVLKAQQGTIGSPKWVALDDWLLWLHAREVKIISSFVGLWVVFGAVLIVNPGVTPDPLATFFAGYSFDSLIDVVIKRFDAFAAPQIKKAADSVAGPPASAEAS